MNIVQTVRAIMAKLPSLAVIAGNGICVQHTSRGAVISLERESSEPAVTVPAWRGMFQLFQEYDDGEDSPRIAIRDANYPDGGHAGIAHLNGQPVLVDAYKDATPPTQTIYYYLEFTLPKESPVIDVDDTPLTARIVSSTTPLENDLDHVMHLVGRLIIETETSTDPETGEQTTTVTRRTTAQDHLPGNLYASWNCPAKHILEP